MPLTPRQKAIWVALAKSGKKGPRKRSKMKKKSGIRDLGRATKADYDKGWGKGYYGSAKQKMDKNIADAAIKRGKKKPVRSPGPPPYKFDSKGKVKDSYNRWTVAFGAWSATQKKKKKPKV